MHVLCMCAILVIIILFTGVCGKEITLTLTLTLTLFYSVLHNYIDSPQMTDRSPDNCLHFNGTSPDIGQQTAQPFVESFTSDYIRTNNLQYSRGSYSNKILS